MIKEVKGASPEERVHMQNLLSSREGKWLFGMMLREYESNAKDKPAGNSWDMYHAGIRNTLGRYRKMVIDHAGHAAVAELLQEEQGNEERDE